MNFKDLCNSRYSVRAYNSKAIEPEKIEYIKACASLAPSAVNKQPWHFYLCSSQESKEKLHQCYDREWFKEAPHYILVCKNESEAWSRRYDNHNHADIDAAIAIEHICLAATEVGLGTCWVCNFRIQLLSVLFNLPTGQQPVAIIPIGYPAQADIPEKTRKSTEETWGEL